MAGFKLNNMKKLIFIIGILLSCSAFGQKEGFYNKDRDKDGIYITKDCTDTLRYNLQYAENGVWGGTWELNKNKKDIYTYPVHGWIWANSKQEAKQFFNLKKYSKETDSETEDK